jgi:hypothetical protein
MAQKLIVEGDNDIHVITHLCLKKGINSIVGFEDETNYKLNFVSNAGGKENAKDQLKIILKKKDNSLKNIGIVIDADSETKNPSQDTWLSISNILREFGYKNIPNQAKIEGTIIEQEGKPKIGLWIMPDNKNEGYLEHFFKHIIVENDEMWLEADYKIEKLIKEKKHRFRIVDKQKAKVHTWLAWQKNPELPMGLALKEKEYKDNFDFNSVHAERFVNWFKSIFDVNLKNT